MSKVFISYAQSDIDLARNVAGALRGAGINVWFAADETYPGDNVPEAIGKALKSSSHIVVLLTEDALSSQFLRHEIESAVSYAIAEPRFERRLIPVVVDDPGGDVEAKMPWILRRMPIVRLPSKTDKRHLRKIVRALKPAA